MSLYARSACDKRQERQLINYLSRFASATRNVFMYKRSVLESHDGPKEERATRKRDLYIYIYVYFFFSLTYFAYERNIIDFAPLNTERPEKDHFI